jgi:hypothetical protein
VSLIWRVKFAMAYLYCRDRFLHNKGAVAAVFLIVGLAAAAICLWIFFFIGRRRRRRRIDHETAVSASLAAAGYNRAPIDDEDDFGPGTGMRQRFNSMSSHPTISTPITEEERAVEAAAVAHFYDPYADFGRPVGGISGYAPVRSDSPSHGRDSSYSSAASRLPASVIASHRSTGSSDPLLTGMVASPSGPPEYYQSNPTVPPRSPRRLVDSKIPSMQQIAVAGSARDSDGRSSPSDRLDPTLTSSQTGSRTNSQDLRDDMDYSRPVLEVCQVVVTLTAPDITCP